MAEIKPVTVHIMGNEYHVSSPADQVEQLEAAARDLDKRMRTIKSGGRIVGTDRIAVMAALNLTYEFQQSHAEEAPMSEEFDSRIKKLKDQVESALASGAQMELT
ncbi:cell division protein ZapA [Aliikangiella maris]|uniref:Cell division protein ZapA n=2 Tax=Aliikangiella maris TaxID=3162458 RepID=A0ABV2BW23_9GAMM